MFKNVYFSIQHHSNIHPCPAVGHVIKPGHEVGAQGVLFVIHKAVGRGDHLNYVCDGLLGSEEGLSLPVELFVIIVILQDAALHCALLDTFLCIRVVIFSAVKISGFRT